MKGHNFAAGSGKFLLQAILAEAGQDVVLAVTGGSLPHIGATAVATPRKSLTGKGASASVSVICQTGHRDDEFARGAARILAIATGGVATVTVGIHIEQATETELELLQYNFYRLLEDIQQYLTSKKQEE